jgi:hypothetical protein
LNDLLEGNANEGIENEYKWMNGVVVRDTNWKNVEDLELISSLERNSSSFIFSEMLKALNVGNIFKPLTIRGPSINPVKSCIELDSVAIKNLIITTQSLMRCDSSTQTNNPPKMDHAKTQTAISKIKDADTQTMQSSHMSIQIQTAQEKLPWDNGKNSSAISENESGKLTSYMHQAYKTGSNLSIQTPTRTELPNDVRPSSNITSSKSTSCKCIKAKCLMFYCPCLKAGKVCNDECCCTACNNNENFLAAKSSETLNINVQQQQARTDTSTPILHLNEDMSFSSQIFVPRLPMNNSRNPPLRTIFATDSDENEKSQNSSQSSFSQKSSATNDSEQDNDKSKKRNRDNNQPQQSDIIRKCSGSSYSSDKQTSEVVVNSNKRKSDVVNNVTNKVSRILNNLSIDMVNAPIVDEISYSRRQAVEKRCDKCHNFQRDCPCNRNKEIEKEKQKRSKRNNNNNNNNNDRNDPFYSESNPVTSIIKNDKTIENKAKNYDNLTLLKIKNKEIKIVNLQNEKLYVTLVPCIRNGNEVAVIQAFSDKVDPNIKQMLSLGDTLVSINNEMLEGKNKSFNQQIESIKNGKRPCLLGFVGMD